MKRKIILSFVLSAIAVSINAQEYNMKINKVNGEVLTIATSEIKDVVFEEIKGKEEEPQDEPRFITMGGKKSVSYTHPEPTRLHKVSRMPSSA